MQIVPTILPGSYPSKVTQPDGYNPSPLPPPTDYYVSKKEILDNFLKRNPSVPEDTIPTFDSDGQLKSSSKTIEGLIDEITAKVTDGATEAYDTLKEIEAYITEDKSGTAAIIKDLGTKATKTELETEVSRAKEAETALGKRVGELEENGGSGGSSVIVDDTLTKDGENPVKSKGIWSAIWGAISAPAASVYEWVTAELGKKQSKLSDAQLAAANSGITAEKVSKLDGVEAGAQKNPDLSGYAKKTDIPAAPDLTDYAKTAEVPAAIAGKEIKPSSVVIEIPDGEGGVYQRLILDGYRVTHEDYQFSDGNPKSIGWADLVIAAKRYDFHECETEEYVFGGVARAAVNAHSYKINHFSTMSYSGTVKNITLWLLRDNNVANDLILVFDCYDEGYRIEWTEAGKGYTFHPRGGDAANLEVVAGKRNVFFITEVQPNVFMVARDELALPNEGGGE